ncbi:hypothetical protein MAR_007481 [Mya arenaria]|uniref:Uncharacterized protein n=2 Tax=Mya arenaria TaxID=6604 RepID=A0ABY7DE65_MYAAR|nr:hypothetical protein MAR_007481 [Mya arenaria]
MNETVQCTCPILKKLADDNVTCIDVLGFYYGLCTCLAVCLMVATGLLARKWCVRRRGAFLGNQRPTANEQKLFVVVTSSQEYGDEFKNINLQKPPPYKEKMDEKDIYM